MKYPFELWQEGRFHWRWQVMYPSRSMSVESVLGNGRALTLRGAYRKAKRAVVVDRRKREKTARDMKLYQRTLQKGEL